MTPERISAAEQFGVSLGNAASHLRMGHGDRVRAAAASLGIARDHHGSIVLLMKWSQHSSAFALLRCLFEAYVRGLWLKHCATDQQIEGILRHNGRFPQTIIAEIERTPDFANGVLSRIKRKAWGAMCDYTHTGGLHLQRWQSSGGIEPVFEAAELEECLNLAEILAAMATLELLEMSETSHRAPLVRELIGKRWP